MQHDEIGKPTRWMIRAMEWDDPRARYPNIWCAGMPRHMLALERLAGRLRLGDLVAIYHPASSRHPERAERFLGLSKVIGLRRADLPGHAWIDVETAHRFQPPLVLDAAPRRVFMCCDPGWPEPDVALFRRVFDAAVADGWQPAPEELEGAGKPKATEKTADASQVVQPVTPPDRPAASAKDVAKEQQPPTRVDPQPASGTDRRFAGSHYSGDMRDPRQGTWLSVLELSADRLRVVRLEATGRNGLQSSLRDPDRMLMSVDAIGLAFPFGLPLAFAESLLGGSFPDEGWWALARRLEHLSRPDYLVALHEFRQSSGEPKRWTDERANADSPLHRSTQDLGPVAYHGIRMIAEDRSRYAIRPFESAQGRLLLEVRPADTLGRLRHAASGGNGRPSDVLAHLAALASWPVEVGAAFRKRCLELPGALEAVVAARSAAVAVLTGEAELRPDQLAPGRGDQVRLEGWIYGLENSA